jgi:hypothetical protein
MPPSFSTCCILNQAFDTKSPKRPIMAGSADHDGRVNGIGVHAALIVMMHGHERPIGDYACDADGPRVGV